MYAHRGYTDFFLVLQLSPTRQMAAHRAYGVCTRIE
jgi:hypothetical protein